MKYFCIIITVLIVLFLAFTAGKQVGNSMCIAKNATTSLEVQKTGQKDIKKIYKVVEDEKIKIDSISKANLSCNSVLEFDLRACGL